MIKLEFIESKTFSRWVKKLGLSDDDVRRIENIIIINPTIGDIQEETGGIRKLRADTVNGKGKSGGSRVHYYVKDNMCYLLALVPKNVADNLSKSDRNELKDLVIRMMNMSESFYMESGYMSRQEKTLFDFLKNGLEDIIAYNDGDKSRAKRYSVEKSVFAESNKKDFKLKIRESNNSDDTIILCSNCIDAIRSRGERVHQLDFDIPEDKLREPTEEEIDEYGFSDWDMVGTCEWCDDLCTEDDLTVCSF